VTLPADWDTPGAPAWEDSAAARLDKLRRDALAYRRQAELAPAGPERLALWRLVDAITAVREAATRPVGPLISPYLRAVRRREQLRREVSGE
jgi:hypothetical protein